jgi:hypothetical protein
LTITPKKLRAMIAHGRQTKFKVKARALLYQGHQGGPLQGPALLPFNMIIF